MKKEFNKKFLESNADFKYPFQLIESNVQSAKHRVDSISI